MEKKYILTTETKDVNGHTLHRIQAIRDFNDVKTGDLGGWIEKEKNLSHEEKCWVYGNAWVFGNALVCGNAWVFGNARMSGNARVYGNTEVYEYALVCGDARVSENVAVYGYSRIHTGSITETTQVVTIGPIGSRNDFTTFVRDNNNTIYVTCGCFGGTIEEFEAKVKERHGGTKYATSYNVITNMTKRYFEIN